MTELLRNRTMSRPGDDKKHKATIIYCQWDDTSVCSHSSETPLTITVYSKTSPFDEAVKLKTIKRSGFQLSITESCDPETGCYSIHPEFCKMADLYHYCKKACDDEEKKESFGMVDSVFWKFGFTKHSKTEILLEANKDHRLSCGCVCISKWLSLDRRYSSDPSDKLIFAPTRRLGEAHLRICEW